MENFKEKRLLTRKDLDRISDKHYIFTKRVCIHIAAVNSKLLELCGVNRDTFREDENIGRYADGRPNGLIYEDAISGIILQKKPPLTVEEIEGIIADTTREDQRQRLFCCSERRHEGFFRLSIEGEHRQSL